MELATDAYLKRHNGDDEEYRRLCREAFELERRAADLVPDGVGNQPTHGVLCRSAAWLAHNAGRHQEAFDTAHEGVAGKPPAWLQAELAEVINVARDALEHEKRWQAARSKPHDG